MRTSNDIALSAIQKVTGCRDMEDAALFARRNQTAYKVALAAVAIARADMVEQVADAAKQYFETIKTE